MFSSGRTAGRGGLELEGSSAAVVGEARRGDVGAAGLPVGWSVLLLAGLLGAGWVVARWGRATELGVAYAALTRWLVARREPILNGVTEAVTWSADTLTVAGLAAAAGVWLVWQRGPLLIAEVVVGEVAVFLAVSALVDRERPADSMLDAAAPTSSFPSGHIAARVVSFGVLR